MNISIVAPTASDIPGIQNVFYKTWLATYPNAELGITEDDIHDRFKNGTTPEVLAKRWAKIQNEQAHPEIGLTLVAKVAGEPGTEAGEKVVGVGHVLYHADKNQLQAIYILPEYQREGIGRMLYEALANTFDPKKRTIVQVATYNQRAINFYEKLGFTDNGKRWQDEKFRLKSGAIIPEMEMEMGGLGGTKN